VAFFGFSTPQIFVKLTAGGFRALNRSTIGNRKMNSLILKLIILALLSAPLVVKAQFEYTTNFTDVTNNGVIMTNGSITITGYGGPGGAVVIPAELTGYPVTSIAAGAFEYDTTLTNVSVPDSVMELGNDAFGYCYGLTNVSLGSGVTNIGGNMTTFGGHYAIGSDAFLYCTNLIYLAVDSQNPAYSSLDGVMFDKNQGTLIQFPPGLTGGYAIPEGVTNIGFEAFATALVTGVTIPDSVTTITFGAFEECDDLENIFIGSGLTSTILAFTTSFPSGATLTSYSGQFTACPSLTNITVDAANPVLSSVNGVVFNKDQTMLVTVPCGLSGTYEVPDSVTVIGPLAFGYCSNLTHVVLDAGVTNIQPEAFENCSDLTALYFEGNAPTADSTGFGSGPGIFVNSDPTNYYLPNATGFLDWTVTTEGFPIALWLPQIQAAGAGFGAQAGQFAFKINWARGQTVVVQACPDITNPVWEPVWTNTLAGLTTNFSDPQWADYPNRFYRLANQDGQ
jgi:hypothetical protein